MCPVHRLQLTSRLVLWVSLSECPDVHRTSSSSPAQPQGWRRRPKPTPLAFRKARTAYIFFAEQMFVLASHRPPAFAQSAAVFALVTLPANAGPVKASAKIGGFTNALVCNRCSHRRYFRHNHARWLHSGKCRGLCPWCISGRLCRAPWGCRHAPSPLPPIPLLVGT